MGVPAAALLSGRLAAYFYIAAIAGDQGHDRLRSDQLALALNIGPSHVRRDLGSVLPRRNDRRGYARGYATSELVAELGPRAKDPASGSGAGLLIAAAANGAELPEFWSDLNQLDPRIKGAVDLAVGVDKYIREIVAGAWSG